MSQGKPSVLVVDDDPVVAGSLVPFLRDEGHASASAGSAEAALAALRAAEADGERGGFGIAIVDVSLGGEDGLELVRRIRAEHAATAVVVLTGYGSVDAAVRALRLGAADFLTKPAVDAELRVALERASAQHALLAENAGLRRAVERRTGLSGIVGRDARMSRVYELVRAVAPGKTTVLMTGESGTGKSLVARAIHDLSPRRDRPFVEISCGSIPESLLESELFGHVKGAFTGAHADKVGRFAAAHGGTLFLDEINSASPAMQLKLLRVLQERRFEPVGSSKTVEADVRVVLASNQPLEALVADGRFRQDLYYRINVVTIELPPLRERRADVAELATQFLRAHGAELGKALIGFTPEAAAALERYPFPGNVRELRNIVERAAVLSTSPTIGLQDLPDALTREAPAPAGPRAAEPEAAWVPVTLEEALREPERRILLRALEANGWNRQRTADQLGINRTTLYKKMRTLGIDGPEREAA